MQILYELTLPFIVFILFVFIHILLHRRTRKFITSPFTTGIIFVGGLITLLIHYLPYIVKNDFRYYPFSMMIIYLLLVMDYMTEIATPLLGQESPSAKILYMLEKNKYTKDELLQSFSDKTLIYKRLDDLEHAGMVKRKDDTYIILSKGKIMVTMVMILRTIMNIEKAG